MATNCGSDSGDSGGQPKPFWICCQSTNATPGLRYPSPINIQISQSSAIVLGCLFPLCSSFLSWVVTFVTGNKELHFLIFLILALILFCSLILITTSSLRVSSFFFLRRQSVWRRSWQAAMSPRSWCFLSTSIPQGGYKASEGVP